MWLCALTLVPSEMDILHFLHQKDFHQNSTFLNQQKHLQNKTTHFSTSFSRIFFYVPLVSSSSFQASHRARGDGDMLRSVPVKVTVAPPTAVLGVVSISGVEAAATPCLEKILGGILGASNC